jgi:hypothetical protein
VSTAATPHARSSASSCACPVRTSRTSSDTRPVWAHTRSSTGVARRLERTGAAGCARSSETTIGVGEQQPLDRTKLVARRSASESRVQRVPERRGSLEVPARGDEVGLGLDEQLEPVLGDGRHGVEPLEREVALGPCDTSLPGRGELAGDDGDEEQGQGGDGEGNGDRGRIRHGITYLFPPS